MLNCHVRLSNDKVYLVHSHFLGCSRNLSISFFVLSSCPVSNSLTDMIHLPWSVAIHYLWLNFVWANDNKDLNTFKLIAPSLKSTPVLNNRLFFIVEIGNYDNLRTWVNLISIPTANSASKPMTPLLILLASSCTSIIALKSFEMH